DRDGPIRRSGAHGAEDHGAVCELETSANEHRAVEARSIVEREVPGHGEDALCGAAGDAQITGRVHERGELAAGPVWIEGIAPVVGRIEIALAIVDAGPGSSGADQDAVREALEVFPVERPESIERMRVRE